MAIDLKEELGGKLLEVHAELANSRREIMSDLFRLWSR